MKCYSLCQEDTESQRKRAEPLTSKNPQLNGTVKCVNSYRRYRDVNEVLWDSKYCLDTRHCRDAT